MAARAVPNTTAVARPDANIDISVDRHVSMDDRVVGRTGGDAACGAHMTGRGASADMGAGVGVGARHVRACVTGRMRRSFTLVLGGKACRWCKRQRSNGSSHREFA